MPDDVGILEFVAEKLAVGIAGRIASLDEICRPDIAFIWIENRHQSWSQGLAPRKRIVAGPFPNDVAADPEDDRARLLEIVPDAREQFLQRPLA